MIFWSGENGMAFMQLVDYNKRGEQLTENQGHGKKSMMRMVEHQVFPQNSYFIT